MKEFKCWLLYTDEENDKIYNMISWIKNFIFTRSPLPPMKFFSRWKYFHNITSLHPSFSLSPGRTILHSLSFIIHVNPIPKWNQCIKRDPRLSEPCINCKNCGNKERVPCYGTLFLKKKKKRKKEKKKHFRDFLKTSRNSIAKNPMPRWKKLLVNLLGFHQNSTKEGEWEQRVGKPREIKAAS